MRSRYQPDGSVDPEADRMLEILRHADSELARQQREQARQAWRHGAGPKPKKITTPQTIAKQPPWLEHVDNPFDIFFEDGALQLPDIPSLNKLDATQTDL